VIDQATSEPLDEAATQLLRIGCADPDRVDAAVRLRCLWAVEELRTVGAHPRRDLGPHGDADAPGVISAALTALGRVAAAPGTDASVADTLREVIEKLRDTPW
jgi:hypothetical protein